MRLIHKRDNTRAVRERWLSQYQHTPDVDIAMWAQPRTYGDIRRALAKLDLETCSEADVDAAIGTDGWAANNCDECGANSETLVHLGAEPDYEARWQDLCIDCLRKGIDLAAPVSSTAIAPEGTKE